MKFTALGTSVAAAVEAGVLTPERPRALRSYPPGDDVSKRQPDAVGSAGL